MSPLFILLCVAGVTLLLLSIYVMWTLGMQTPQVLMRQAKKKKWVITNQMDVDGYRNVYISRDDVRALISYKHANIELIQPFCDNPFASFTEVELWLKNHDAMSGQDQHDPIWESITDSLAAEIQTGFMKVYADVNLNKYTSSQDIPTQIRIKFSETANATAQKNKINPALVLLVIHQYIDSDETLRQEHTGNWVTFMKSRPTIAPQPETYASFINTTYFNGQLA